MRMTPSLLISLALPLAAQEPALTPAQWREDLAYFARELPRRHKNLFHAVTRDTFDARVARLDRDIPSLEPHQIVVRLRQISAAVGDGHTGVHIPRWFRIYPLTVYWFGDELRVTSAAPAYRQAVGGRVVRIGDVDLAEVMARLSTTYPSAANENEWFVLSTSTAMILRPEILHTLGIVADLGPTPFTFETEQGERITLSIAPVEPPPVVNGTAAFAGFVTAVSNPPLSRQRPAEPFWFTLLPDSQTVYVNFRSYRSLGGKARELFAFLDRVRPQRLVVDLRQNGGGDFNEGRRHLVEPLRARPWLNQKDRLFVLIGRRTYSAAMANAVHFRTETQATLVGEPIGERPNSYSENDELTLPHSRVVVSYSTRYYQFVPEDVPAVLPDVRIDVRWSDFRAGRDPVLDWVTARPLPPR